jgi:hypothetical protein
MEDERRVEVKIIIFKLVLLLMVNVVMGTMLYYIYKCFGLHWLIIIVGLALNQQIVDWTRKILDRIG